MNENTTEQTAGPAANTTADRPVPAALTALPPFPEGWYLVTTRETLQRKT